MRRILLNSIVLVICAGTFVAVAYGRQLNARIDPSQPSARLCVERHDATAVWFRLSNNSRWAMSLRLEHDVDRSDAAAFTTADGFNASGIRDGAAVSPDYYIASPFLDGGLGGRYSCTSVASWLPPGHSVMFQIPRSELPKLGDIEVNFTYDWEPDGVGPRHQVVLRWIDESVTAVGAFTQQDAPVVAWIEIDGNNRYSDTYIAGLIKTRPQQTFDSAELDADLQQLVDSGLFDPEQTSVSSEDLGDGRVKVRFDVYEWRLISDVSFPGLDVDQVTTIQRLFREQSIHVALGEPCKVDELDKAQAVIAKYLKERDLKSWVTFEAETDELNATVRFVLKPEH